MATRTDPIAVPSQHGADRLNYVQGTLLDSSDFSAEQSYHRGRLARALAYLFGPGTVAGLDLQWSPERGEIEITPGLAIDPLGRLIEIPAKRCIAIREWFAAQRKADLRNAWIAEFTAPTVPAVLIADVFIRFRTIEQGKTPKFADGPFDALNALAPARLRDDFQIQLVLREEAGRRREALASPTPPSPLPVIPTPDADEILLSLDPDDLTAIHQRIFDLWRDEVADWRDGVPPRLREHLAPRTQLSEEDPTELGRDPSSLMLARVAVPVDAAEGADPTLREQAPLFDATSVIPEYRTGKFIRRFVYALGHLTQPAAAE